MKRTPLQRRNPLLARTPMSRGTGMRRGTPPAAPATDRPPAPALDLTAAAAALNHQALHHTPSGYTGPVETSKPTPRPQSTGFPSVVRQTVLDRDHMRCARCGRDVDTSPVGYSLQHRDNRGSGGTRDPRVNLPSNGLTLCGSGTTGCHGRAEANPRWAERLGYAVASWADPETVPVLTWQGWVLLTNKGTLWPTKEPPNGDAHTVARRKESRP